MNHTTNSGPRHEGIKRDGAAPVLSIPVTLRRRVGPGRSWTDAADCNGETDYDIEDYATTVVLKADGLLDYDGTRDDDTTGCVSDEDEAYEAIEAYAKDHPEMRDKIASVLCKAFPEMRGEIRAGCGIESAKGGA